MGRPDGRGIGEGAVKPGISTRRFRVLDRFARPDAPDLGAQWTGGMWTGEPSPVIQNGRCVSGVALSSALWNASPLPGDQELGVIWITGRVLLDMRVSGFGATLNSYECSFDPNTNISIINLVSGGTSIVNLATGSIGPTPPPNSIFSVSAVGNRIALKVNGVEILAATDPTWTSGSVGIELVGTGTTIAGFGLIGTNERPSQSRMHQR